MIRRRSCRSRGRSKGAHRSGFLRLTIGRCLEALAFCLILLLLCANWCVGEDAIVEAYRLIHTGRAAEAVSKLQPLPVKAEKMLALGRAYYRIGQPENAIIALHRCLHTEPRAAWTTGWSYYFLGASYEKLGRKEEAKKWFEKAISLNATRSCTAVALREFRKLAPKQKPPPTPKGTVFFQRPGPPLVNTKAPNFNIKGAFGETYSLDRLKGSLTLIQFGASWCGGCQSAVNPIRKMLEDVADKGVVYLKIFVGENERAALDFGKHYRTDLMLAIDADYAAVDSYNAASWPSVAIIDRKGILRFFGRATSAYRQGVRDVLYQTATSLPATLPPGVSMRNGTWCPKFVEKAWAVRRDRSPRLALDPEGKPWVAFYSNRDGANNIYVMSFDEKGDAVDEAVTTGGADAYAPDCVFDTSGVLFVVWCSNREGRYDIYVRARRNGQWLPSARLSDSEDDAMRPRIAAGPKGRLSVTYYKWQKIRNISRDRGVFVRTYDPETGMWSAEVEVSPREPQSDDHTDPDVAIDEHGKAWVAWSYDYHQQSYANPLDTNEPSIFAARVPHQGESGQPLLVGTVGARHDAVDLFPSVAFDRDGVLWCAWDMFEFFRDEHRRVRLASFSEGRFADAVDMSPPGVPCCTPEISSGNNGTMLLAWAEKHGMRWKGKVLVLSGRRRIAETIIEDPSGDVRFPQAQQGPDGRIWVVYEALAEEGSHTVLKEFTKNLRPVATAAP